MGYRNLLPDADSVAVDLADAGLTAEQQQRVFDSVAYFISEYADFYQNEYERIGEKEDKGAQEALGEIVEMFRSEARYSTSKQG
jgi:hypothetical protein